MFYSFLSVLLAVVPSARATTYDVELAVPSQFPTWMNPDSAYGSGRALFPSNQNDFIVSSTDPRVECAVENGWIVVEMNASKDDYPTLPFSATCTYLGDTLNIDVVAMSAATDPSLQSHSISALTQKVEIGKVTGAILIRHFLLPSNVNFVDGSYLVSNMAGAKCFVADNGNGTQRVTVRHPKGAAAGTGACSLPKVDGGKYSLTVEVSISDI